MSRFLEVLNERHNELCSDLVELTVAMRDKLDSPDAFLNSTSLLYRKESTRNWHARQARHRRHL